MAWSPTGVQIPWRRKLHAEISPALSDLEAFFNGDEKHPDRGLARAAALDLRKEVRQPAEGVARQDKGARKVYRLPKAQLGVTLVEPDPSGN